MSKKSPSVENVLAALPAVQAAIREEVAARISAGEAIVSEDSSAIREALAARRKVMDSASRTSRVAERKSAA
jgi:hypothetical protein